MEINRRLPSGAAVCFLLLVGALAGVDETGFSLDCFNDFNYTMSCQLIRPNCSQWQEPCSQYNLTLSNIDWNEMEQCTMQQYDTGQCCCSVRMSSRLVAGEEFNATVWKGGKRIKSKTIFVHLSVKPNPPTIVSVTESNRNFEVRWKTNMRGPIISELKAEVTYYKKGDIKKVKDTIDPATDSDNLMYYEINGESLEPSSTYVVSVKSIRNSSNLMVSESSAEWEFKTPARPVSEKVIISIIIVILCIGAVAITGAVYWCYITFKAKWWDIVGKYSNSTLLNMNRSEQEVLKPVKPPISSVCVEPFIPDESKPWSETSLASDRSLEKSSGISAASSGLSYANTASLDIKAGVEDALRKAFPNISPVLQLNNNPLPPLDVPQDRSLVSIPYDPCDVRTSDMSSGSSCFENKTYSLLLPNGPHRVTTDITEVDISDKISCNSEHHPSSSDMANHPDQQVSACLVPVQQVFPLTPAGPFLLPIDVSYQRCNADCGRFLYADDPSLSSVSSGKNTTTTGNVGSKAEVGFQNSNVGSGEVEGNGDRKIVVKCDEDPCYNCVPGGAHSSPTVDDDYQPFQSLVVQSKVLHLEEGRAEHQEHLGKYSEDSFTTCSQSFLNPNVSSFINTPQSELCQTPFFSVMSASQSVPIIVDSDYQSV
ncbi:uncharacterized protein KZ484_001634 [Pholidichthys leucotaenia]